MLFRSPAFGAALALAVVLLSRSTVCAQDVTWLGGNGFWNVPANWTGGVTPGSGTNAIIESGTVSLPSTVSGTANNAMIGYSGTGALNISGGTLTTQSSFIANNAGSSGQATISSGTWDAGRVVVGGSGAGTLNISGGYVTGFLGYIAYMAGSTGTASVSSGTWNNTNLYAGNSGTGTLNISGGSVAASNLTLIGNNAGTQGTVSVTGGQFLTKDQFVGYSGTGSLSINGGNVNASEVISIANLAGSKGTVTVTSGTLSSASVITGSGGSGVLNINGGTVTDASGIIGQGAGSVGTVTLNSGTWRNTTQLLIGTFSTAAALNINGGTLAGNMDFLGFNPSGSGTANVAGGSWTYAKLFVGSSGTATLNLSAGTMSGSSTIFALFGGTGTGNITGGTLNSTTEIIVGYGGRGILNLSGTGIVTIAGGTGTLTLGNNSSNGGIGDGTLNLGTGGAVGTLNAATVTSGPGTARVNFNHTGSYTMGAQLTGSLSVGQLGGTTILTGSNTYTGATTISKGILNVTGTLANSDVTVGSGGTLSGTGTIGGSVTVAAGGSLAPGTGTGAGTLTFPGTLAFSNGSMLNLQLDKIAVTSTSNHILATGTTTINITALNGAGPGNYEIISGATGVSAGSFSIGSAPAGHFYGLSASGGTIAVLLDSIAAWRYTYFDTIQDSGSAANTAAPAGDQVTNLMKYALGMDPRIAYGGQPLKIPSPGVVTSGSNQYLTLNFTGNAADVTYRVEATSDLTGTWTTLYNSAPGSAPGTVTVSDTTPMTSASRRFMHLQVVAP